MDKIDRQIDKKIKKINRQLTKKEREIEIPDIAGDYAPGVLADLPVLDDVVVDGAAPVLPPVQVQCQACTVH